MELVLLIQLCLVDSCFPRPQTVSSEHPVIVIFAQFPYLQTAFSVNPGPTFSDYHLTDLLLLLFLFWIYFPSFPFQISVLKKKHRWLKRKSLFIEIRVSILTIYFRPTRFKRKKMDVLLQTYGIRDNNENLFFCS